MRQQSKRTSPQGMRPAGPGVCAIMWMVIGTVPRWTGSFCRRLRAGYTALLPVGTTISHNFSAGLRATF